MFAISPLWSNMPTLFFLCVLGVFAVQIAFVFAVPAPRSRVAAELTQIDDAAAPREPTAARVYVWRKLKQLGAIAVQDAVWVLPDNPRTREQFQWLAAEIVELGGEVFLFSSQVVFAHPAASLQEQFTKEALGTPFCPNAGVGAATAGFHIGLCDPFFTHTPVCQRDELVHEIFHSLGIHHGGTARDPNACVSRASMSGAQALDSCDNLSMLISETVSGTFDACGKSCFGDDPRILADDVPVVPPA